MPKACSALLCLSLTATATLAQGIPLLSLGSPQQVAFSAQAMQDFHYEGRADEALCITLRGIGEASYQGQALGVPPDPVLILVDPQGRTLAYADDNGAAHGLAIQDAALCPVVLPRAGRYIIRADTFSGLTEGAGELLARPWQPVLPSLKADAWQSLTWPIGGAAQALINVRAGQRLLIRARASDASDTILTLLDEQGQTLAKNDDHASTALDLRSLDSALTWQASTDSVLIVQLHDALGRAGQAEAQFIFIASER
ncbi:MAG: hypothetical protein NZ750_11985 [Anaerolineae bacterium]|nr:hypothetical protein [Anaerolineae bacterium]MDW8173918.1 hypothetical protein [Anaerolineae bacterium]